MEEDLKRLRHSAAHILAQAVKRLYPNAKLAIGPAIDDGFYYDFDVKLTSDDLQQIQSEMKRIVKESLTIERFELSYEEAVELMQNEPYKLELIEALSKDNSPLVFYKQGEFVDLCIGPHIDNTKYIKAFKLTALAGAYWHGDEKNKMLTRIYGTAFFNKDELNDYIERLEEAKRRDHRKLGRELELFMFTEDGVGMPFFLPNGLTVKNILIDYWRKLHKKCGYKEISTPIVLNKSLWEQSGHWYHYRDNMYTTVIEEQDFAIKPMNCPGGILVYKSKMHSYRELPLRLAELGTVHRHEKSGALHGLMRVRSFTQDDAHIFMTHEQMISEIKNVIDMISKVYERFGFKYSLELSTRPEDSMGSDEQWTAATNALQSALGDMPYKINEGDGAFYGPKIDFHLEDSIGRTWQCGTIQLDFQMPEQFDLEYIGADNSPHRPIMIHRVIFGSVERFIGILIEHYAGKLPLWLAPVQARVLPISDKFIDYANEIAKTLEENDVRVEIDSRTEKIGYKIREGKLNKIPYLIIVGEAEQSSQTISVRTDENISMSLSDFVSKIKNELMM